MGSDSSWPEWFYTHFIGRDFVYLFSGGSLICIVKYALFDEIILPNQISLELFGFLSASYFLGLILMFFFTTGDNLKPDVDKYQSEILFYRILREKNFDDRDLNRLERMNYHSLIGLSLGYSSVLGGIFMLIITLGRLIFESVPFSIKYIMLAVGLIIIGILMIKKMGEPMSKIYKLECRSMTK